MEAGWAGVALGRSQPTKAVVARHFPKDLNVFDGDLRARTIRTIQNPTAIRVFDEETYLVAETNKLALYDLRVGEREVCVQYLQLNEMVACLAVGTEGMPGGLQVASGVGRTVALWDARKWNILKRFSGLRQEPCGLTFLKSKPEALCVASMNGEINILGYGNAASTANTSHSEERPLAQAPPQSHQRQRGKKKFHVHASLRGDSRWIGLCTQHAQAAASWPKTDRCICLGASGGLYTITI